MSYVFLALPGKENSRAVQHILTTPSGGFLLPCVSSLHCLVKKNSRPVQHILTTPSGVFLMPCVFLAPPGKETNFATHSGPTISRIFLT
jgi:hypothetical protein